MSGRQPAQEAKWKRKTGKNLGKQLEILRSLYCLIPGSRTGTGEASDCEAMHSNRQTWNSFQHVGRKQRNRLAANNGNPETNIYFPGTIFGLVWWFPPISFLFSALNEYFYLVLQGPVVSDYKHKIMQSYKPVSITLILPGWCYTGSNCKGTSGLYWVLASSQLQQMNAYKGGKKSVLIFFYSHSSFKVQSIYEPTWGWQKTKLHMVYKGTRIN